MVKLGKTGFSISPVGFGGYRIHDSDAGHRAALKLAFDSGCNLIDTSANYTDGGSERLIGQVLAETGKRDKTVIVTKAGYVQGENMAIARERLVARKPFPEIVKYSEDCWHCISPEFLEDQITRSLRRLGVASIDVLLLHNPEYFLKAENDHREYYRRIRKAFEYLEKEVDRGRIKYYGISSNTFPDPKDSPHFTSLEVVLELARDLGPQNHFAVIQFPFNLLESGAAFEANNNGRTVLELAMEADLGTLINRPLNAFDGNRLVRLADFPAHHGEDVEGNFASFLNYLMDHETEFSKQGGTEILPLSRISWGHTIRKNLDYLSDLETWKGVLEYQILPARSAALAFLRGNPRFAEWADVYEKSSEKLFSAMTALLESRAAAVSSKLTGLLDLACPELKSSRILSRRCVRLYRSLPGLHCVLVGMRKERYARDALEMEQPVDSQAAFRALAAIQEERQRS